MYVCMNYMNLCLERETSKLQEKLPSYRRETSKLRSIYSCCIVVNACSELFGELHALIEFSSTTKDHEVTETHLAEKMREKIGHQPICTYLGPY